ncbi:MAG: 2-dehydropantoate 2-reductase, partial [Acetobacteraceae bacterium]
GAGATGGYFGARLAAAGRDTTFLVRPARADQLRRDGLRITSPHGNLTLAPRLVTAEQIAAPYDLVLLTVKAFALDQALADIAPAVGPGTTILPLLNGLRHLDVISERFGAARVLGGVCVVATMLDPEGRIVQLAEMQQITYGELDGTTSARIAALDATLAGAGFATTASATILQAMWEKWVMLAALGAITCLMRGTVGEIAHAPGGADLARQMLRECAAIATAAGYPPAAAFRARTEAMLTAPGSGLASSMFRDLRQDHQVEAEHILGDLLARAQHLGVTAPLLATAFAHLMVYQNHPAAH